MSANSTIAAPSAARTSTRVHPRGLRATFAAAVAGWHDRPRMQGDTTPRLRWY
jgi:hypothetical protein